MKHRFLSVVMAFLVFSGILLLPAVEPVNAASTETYYLPEKVTAYSWDEGSWDKGFYYKLTYNSKGDIKSYKTDIGLPGTTTIKWKYSKKGKPVKAVIKSKKYSSFTTTITYKKGKPVSACTSEKGHGKLTQKYVYNKKGYVYKVTSDFKSLRRKFGIKYHSNGLPSKITQGKESWKFNEEGLMIWDSWGDTYEYTYDDQGRITSAIGYTEEDGEIVPSIKMVYTYGKAKTSNRKKYIGLMGYMIWGNSPINIVTGNPFPEHTTFN